MHWCADHGRGIQTYRQRKVQTWYGHFEPKPSFLCEDADSSAATTRNLETFVRRMLNPVHEHETISIPNADWNSSTGAVATVATAGAPLPLISLISACQYDRSTQVDVKTLIPSVFCRLFFKLVLQMALFSCRTDRFETGWRLLPTLIH